MTIQGWNPELEMDNEIIDTHHKELFELISMLDSAVIHQDEDVIQEILTFLNTYVMDHFDEEEHLMKETNFAGAHHHHTDHLYFRGIVADLQKDFYKGTFRTHLIFRIRQFVDKLVAHIQTVDSQLAVHLKRLNHPTKGNKDH